MGMCQSQQDDETRVTAPIGQMSLALLGVTPSQLHAKLQEAPLQPEMASLGSTLEVLHQTGWLQHMSFSEIALNGMALDRVEGLRTHKIAVYGDGGVEMRELTRSGTSGIVGCITVEIAAPDIPVKLKAWCATQEQRLAAPQAK